MSTSLVREALRDFSLSQPGEWGSSPVSDTSAAPVDVAVVTGATVDGFFVWPVALFYFFTTAGMFYVDVTVIVKPAPPNAKIVCSIFSRASSGLASPVGLPSAQLVPASVAATPSFAVSTIAGFNLPATTAGVSTFLRASFGFYILL